LPTTQERGTGHPKVIAPAITRRRGGWCGRGSRACGWVNPGRAAVIAVALLAILYTLAQTGLQGVVSPARLQANASTALVSVAAALGGTGWAKLMALSIALSVTAATAPTRPPGARSAA
jgi:hypothetical protein